MAPWSTAHGAGAVAVAVQDANGTAGLGDVGGLEVQRLLDAKASPIAQCLGPGRARSPSRSPRMASSTLFPATNVAIPEPNSRPSAASVYGVSSTVSCSIAAHK